jgi:hypothetical protein
METVPASEKFCSLIYAVDPGGITTVEGISSDNVSIEL